MTRTKSRTEEAPATPDRSRDGAEAERLLGRILAKALPLTCIGIALVAGVVAPSIDAGRIVVNLGPALIVLACGALFAAIGLLWASLRTLSGDAPLPAAFEVVAFQSHGIDAVAEQKRRVLRALKDLEAEHAIGKIDDADYLAIAARYREEAKAMMRRMDEDIAPARAEAERLANEYITRGPQVSAAAAEPTSKIDVAQEPDRLGCAKCGASNERDALFCKQCGFRFGKTTGQDDVAS